MRGPVLLGCLGCLVAACLGCGAPEVSQTHDDPTERPAPTADGSRDLIATHLVVNVATRTGTATITAAAAESRGLSLEVGNLEIIQVTDEHGALRVERAGDRLHIGVPATGSDTVVTIDYGYSLQSKFEGAMDSGLTMTWPYFCGNLFPCKSAPADGLELSLELMGIGDGQTAVFPQNIPADAPSYMLAWAIDEFTYVELGTTIDGTEVGYYHRPGAALSATMGTANLLASFDWFEQNIGTYLFGNRVASVAANWGLGAFGGMEHHPFWHVSTGAMSDEETHVHEAAHGWFGNGIRMECWEDFVLSEGTVTYLAARALDAVAGQAVSEPIWNGYSASLQSVVGDMAWPEGCNIIDIIEDDLFGSAPYVKGAFFYRAVAEHIGKSTLDGVLSSFYAIHAGKAAGMQDMLDHIESETGYDPTGCADAWLRQTTLPPDGACP